MLNEQYLMQSLHQFVKSLPDKACVNNQDGYMGKVTKKPVRSNQKQFSRNLQRLTKSIEPYKNTENSA